MKIEKSEQLFSNAQKYIPGGVNSPVRAFKSVGGNPLFIEKGYGSKIVDVDGNEYIEYIGSWGPHLFGHNPPFIKEALLRTIENGTSFGAPTAIEVEMAKLFTFLIPSCEMVRMVNSGTEATMSAVRVARGYTEREKIIKFEGCYHGHADFFLIKAGSGALTLGVPNSPGVPKATADLTVTLPYNDLAAVSECLQSAGEDIAAIIVEPVAGNMNCIPPLDGYLAGLRLLCDEYGCLLIFDEVMTGFRVALGGAQGLYGITPDLSTFGKVIGGGMPVGAFGGKQEYMELVAPSGPVYQAGTLSGNPVAMAAGLANLELISREGFFTDLADRAVRLTRGIQQAANDSGVPMLTTCVGGMFGLFFTDAEKVINFAEAGQCDTEAFKAFFHLMLERGVNLAPSAFETGFVSSAHSEEHINATIAAAGEAFARL